ncbi:hypothetical protein OS122_02685 [Mycolicibacterium mucogenicum]|uniref:hypothetical protein n=1 Tax=Mycolicibacterium mucogenicum TaxID=56689 RepID=UPI002269D132|nr:hypothetical protein [Mycolicibacterium mucogenicum]MCX8559805.1 hypothetical protein [Mycolicibacterium mucogenicum]
MNACEDQTEPLGEAPEVPATTASLTLTLATKLLEANGYAVIKLPTVAHKGPHDTDAMFFRQVADRFEHNPDSYVGGSNVRRAVSQLLRAAANAAEAMA